MFAKKRFFYGVYKHDSNLQISKNFLSKNTYKMWNFYLGCGSHNFFDPAFCKIFRKYFFSAFWLFSFFDVLQFGLNFLIYLFVAINMAKIF